MRYRRYGRRLVAFNFPSFSSKRGSKVVQFRESVGWKMRKGKRTRSADELRMETVAREEQEDGGEEEGTPGRRVLTLAPRPFLMFIVSRRAQRAP